MPYNINRSDGTIQIIADSAIDTSKYSIGVPGNFAEGYGEAIANAFVNSLENFCASTPPPRVIPGQLWFDSSVDTLKVNISSSDGNDDPSDWGHLVMSDNLGNIQGQYLSFDVVDLLADTIGTNANKVTDIYVVNGNIDSVVATTVVVDVATVNDNLSVGNLDFDGSTSTISTTAGSNADINIVPDGTGNVVVGAGGNATIQTDNADTLDISSGAELNLISRTAPISMSANNQEVLNLSTTGISPNVLSISTNTSTDGVVISSVGDASNIVFDLGASHVLKVSDPTSYLSAIESVGNSAIVTKQYVDALFSGKDYKDAVRVATTTNITLSGTQTIDDVSVNVGDRVLVKNQSTASNNGIYVVSAGAWTRAEDADGNPDGEVSYGMFTLVVEGTDNQRSGFILSTPDPIVIGTTPLTFVKTEVGAVYTSGSGVDISTNVISVDNTVVRTSGDQTIIDVKTFEDPIVFEAGIVSPGPSASSIQGNWAVPTGSSIYSIGGDVLATGPAATTTSTGLVELSTAQEVYEASGPGVVTPSALATASNHDEIISVVDATYPGQTLTDTPTFLVGGIPNPPPYTGTNSYWSLEGVIVVYAPAGNGGISLIRDPATSSLDQYVYCRWNTTTGMKEAVLRNSVAINIPASDIVGETLIITVHGSMNRSSALAFNIHVSNETSSPTTPAIVRRSSYIKLTRLANT